MVSSSSAAFLVAVAVASASAAAAAKATVPSAVFSAGFQGQWTGNISASPTGPSTVEIPNFLVVSSADEFGNQYFRHLYEDQTMRVRGSLMEYCFGLEHPSAPVVGSDVAPFQVMAANETSVHFCWRGPRLPSHPAWCTGCDCASWVLELDKNGLLRSTFSMSPPAHHMVAVLRKTGEAPSPETVRDGWNCHFDNFTGNPNAPPPLEELLPPGHPTLVPTRYVYMQLHLSRKRDLSRNLLLCVEREKDTPAAPLQTNIRHKVAPFFQLLRKKVRSTIHSTTA